MHGLYDIRSLPLPSDPNIHVGHFLLVGGGGGSSMKCQDMCVEGLKIDPCLRTQMPLALAFTNMLQKNRFVSFF